MVNSRLFLTWLIRSNFLLNLMQTLLIFIFGSFSEAKILIIIFQWWWFIVVSLGRSLFEQFQTRICLAHPHIKRHDKVLFRYVFLIFFPFQHHIHEQIFNTFFTNMHPISFSWILLPLVQLNLVKLKFNWIWID